jgi:hypothetical protein
MGGFDLFITGLRATVTVTVDLTSTELCTTEGEEGAKASRSLGCLYITINFY